VNLDRLRLVNVERFDVQYDRKGRYRGITLRELLHRFRPEISIDLAILHFVNGMAIPVPFRDSVAMSRLDPFIATAMTADPLPTPALGRFPDIVKKDSPVDRRAIQFSGNKIVVADRWHPDVSSTIQPGFSPWVHADTLAGIELVAADAYYAQFDVGGDASVRAGLALFRQSCQFCHGVRELGATFGWDFVDSALMSGYQDSAANLYHNIAYKPTNAAELGLMMPRLGFLTEEAAGNIRQWVQALGTTPMPPYKRP
jgi:mono/diheme cytochrome c family protein